MSDLFIYFTRFEGILKKLMNINSLEEFFCIHKKKANEKHKEKQENTIKTQKHKEKGKHGEKKTTLNQRKPRRATKI